MPQIRGTGSGIQHSPFESQSGGWEAIEEIDDPALERILGTDNEKSVALDQLFEYGRAVPEMVRGRADVGSDGVPHQGRRIMPEIRREQGFDGWPNTIDD